MFEAYEIAMIPHVTDDVIKEQKVQITFPTSHTLTIVGILTQLLIPTLLSLVLFYIVIPVSPVLHTIM